MPGRGNSLCTMKHRTTPVGGTGPKRSRKERIANTRATKIIIQNVKKNTNHNADYKRQQLKQKLDKKY